MNDKNRSVTFQNSDDSDSDLEENLNENLIQNQVPQNVVVEPQDPPNGSETSEDNDIFEDTLEQELEQEVEQAIAPEPHKKFSPYQALRKAIYKQKEAAAHNPIFDPENILGDKKSPETGKKNILRKPTLDLFKLHSKDDTTGAAQRSPLLRRPIAADGVQRPLAKDGVQPRLTRSKGEVADEKLPDRPLEYRRFEKP